MTGDGKLDPRFFEADGPGGRLLAVLSDPASAINTTLKPRLLVTPDGGLDARILDPGAPGSKVIEDVVRMFRGPLGLDAISDAHRQYGQKLDPNLNAFENALKALNVSTTVSPASRRNLEAIPKEGPLMLVANHPRSGVEGLAIAAEVAKVRPDIKIVMGPYFEEINTGALSQVKNHTIAVANSGSGEGNSSAVRETLKHLKEGGAVLIFPAGAVSVAEGPGQPARDPAWHDGTVLMAQKSGANVVPVFVGGEPPALSSWVRRNVPQLSPLMLPNEIAGQIGDRVPLEFGPVLPKESLAEKPVEGAEGNRKELREKQRREVTQRLRDGVYALENPR